MVHSRHPKRQRVNVGRTLGTFFRNTGSTISNVVGDLHHDAQAIFTGAKDIILETERNLADVIKTGAHVAGDTLEGLGKNVEGLGQSLSMPLMLMGGAALFLVVSGKLN